CVIWDLGPHDISVLLFWLNAEPVSVNARGSCYIQKNIEDVAFLTIEFSNEIIAHLHLSWLSPCKLRRVTIVGSKKMIVYPIFGNSKILLFEKI
ncbi:MAG: Gfo/Idh/MocA family oxidoreductase, partial [Candidatus Aerophobetes bacterium]|nr:Gfo/Idh/MocA family oxidoreductase [Candidatus Aerophobetes bacterium]